MPENFQLPRSTPEAQGVSTTGIADFAAAGEKHIQNLHGFMLLRNGYLISEACWHLNLSTAGRSEPAWEPPAGIRV